jgi:hypothetical protein
VPVPAGQASSLPHGAGAPTSPNGRESEGQGSGCPTPNWGLVGPEGQWAGEE